MHDPFRQNEIDAGNSPRCLGGHHHPQVRALYLIDLYWVVLTTSVAPNAKSTFRGESITCDPALRLRTRGPRLRTTSFHEPVSGFLDLQAPSKRARRWPATWRLSCGTGRLEAFTFHRYGAEGRPSRFVRSGARPVPGAGRVGRGVGSDCRSRPRSGRCHGSHPRTSGLTHQDKKAWTSEANSS